MATQLNTTASIIAADCFPIETLRCVTPDDALDSPSTVGSFEHPPNSKPCPSQMLDADGLPLISREAIIDALWSSSEDHAMSILELTKTFDLDKKKNGPARRYSFRQLVAEITYIRNDRVKGFTLVLKKSHYPVAC